MRLPAATLIGHLSAGRAQVGMSLAFHLTLAVLGVGLPLMMLISEGPDLRTGDPVWLALARRWSKALAIVFAVGAARGPDRARHVGLRAHRSQVEPVRPGSCRPGPCRGRRHLRLGIRAVPAHRWSRDGRELRRRRPRADGRDRRSRCGLVLLVPSPWLLYVAFRRRPPEVPK